jgi:hypothetical protein
MPLHISIFELISLTNFEMRLQQEWLLHSTFLIFVFQQTGKHDYSIDR